MRAVLSVQAYDWLFICVCLQNCSFVWFESMTESERGCAAGNCFLFTFKKQKPKAEQSARKSGESAAFACPCCRVCVCVCVCVCECERETHTEKAIHLRGNASRLSVCVWFWRDTVGGGVDVCWDRQPDLGCEDKQRPEARKDEKSAHSEANGRVDGRCHLTIWCDVVQALCLCVLASCWLST